MKPHTDKIQVKNITCYAQIGVADNERMIGQKLCIDLEVTLDLYTAGFTDNLSDTISYVELASQVISTTQAKDYKLLEHLSHEICSDLFARFSQLEDISITIYKPHIPNPDFVGEASVSLYRNRYEELERPEIS